MKFPDPLIRGKLIKRYKRFLTDVELEDGSIVVAHCANSGSMESIKEPGSEVWISPARKPDRKLKFTWELVRVGETLVGINTSLPNMIVSEAIEDGLVSELTGYDSLRREVKYGKNSRIDIFLEAENKPSCYVEVKNTTMRRNLKDGPVEFPDAVTSRGTKHLVELSDMVAEGHRSVMFYLVQREDSDVFTVADDIDPTYAAALQDAIKAGVEVLCFGCTMTPDEIIMSRQLQIAL